MRAGKSSFSRFVSYISSVLCVCLLFIPSFLYSSLCIAFSSPKVFPAESPSPLLFTENLGNPDNEAKSDRACLAEEQRMPDHCSQQLSEDSSLLSSVPVKSRGEKLSLSGMYTWCLWWDLEREESNNTKLHTVLETATCETHKLAKDDVFPWTSCPWQYLPSPMILQCFILKLLD